MTGRGWRPLAFLLAMLGFGLRLDTGWQWTGRLLLGRGRRRGSRARAPQRTGSRSSQGTTGDNARGAKEDALRNAIRLTHRHRRLRSRASSSPRAAPTGPTSGRVLAGRAPALGGRRPPRPASLAIFAPGAALAGPPASRGDACRSARRSRRPRSASRRSSVLPLRLGELVRPALLARRVGFGMSPALSSVVLERLFDMLFVILCFLVLSLIYPLPPDLRRAALLLGRGGGRRVRGPAPGAAPPRTRRAPARARPRTACRRGRPRRRGRWPRDSSTRSARSSRGSILGRVVRYSALLWAANALPFLFALLALGIDVPLVPAALASIVIVAAFVFMPQAPGFLGTWQAGCVARARALRRAEGPGGRLLAAHLDRPDDGQRRPGRLLHGARGPLAAAARAAARAAAPVAGGTAVSLDGRRVLVGAERRHRLLQGVRGGAPARAGGRPRAGRDDAPARSSSSRRSRCRRSPVGRSRPTRSA